MESFDEAKLLKLESKDNEPADDEENKCIA